MSLYARWARSEHAEATRIATMVPLAPLFLGLLPFVVAGIGPRLDRRLGLRTLPHGLGSRILGGLLAVLGFGLAFWSIDAQMTRGRGTPLPMMPTRALVTDGPFRYCRNPMTLGAMMAYLGIAIATATTAGTAFVLALAAALVTYLKRLEEHELTERFGADYAAYRRATPFIVPRLPGRRVP